MTLTETYEPLIRRRPEPPIRLVHPDELARLKAWALPTYAEQCAAIERISYLKRKAAHYAPKFTPEQWETAFR